MPRGLKRFYGSGDLHLITCSCHRRRPWLDTAERRDLFLNILEEVRKQHRFVVVGYVVMPEHFHLLMSEPQIGNPSTASFPASIASISIPVWQPRFYDFNVWTEHKRIEKLDYIHRNPAKRGLVEEPEQWRWSSDRSYAFGEVGLVKINDCDILEMRVRVLA
jgi:putative transposase